jgi:hypothetical protein
MSDSKKRSRKQILRQHIASTIAINLGELKEALGEKKFNRKIKEASKILAAAVPKQRKTKKSESQPGLALTAVE